MREDDPLKGWLYMRESLDDPVRRQYRETTTALYLQPPRSGTSEHDGEQIDLHDVMKAQTVFRQVFEAGGPGSIIAQEVLLDLIATVADPRSLPFWIELIDYRRPRESFYKRRRTIIFAALAFLAIQRNTTEVYDALVQLTSHALPEIRELAVEYLGKAYRMIDRTIPPAVIARLSEIASSDTAFAPRYWARRWLREIEAEVPLDNPDGAYVFKVRHSWVRDFHCVIAVLSEQTLADLHSAIQEAFEWDNDHLYAFYMHGEAHDRRYMLAGPYLEEVPAYVDDLFVGELGLVLKHKFTYFFDFGDSHEFDVEVVDIQPVAQPGPYPQLIERQGTPPAQYYWEDEDDVDQE